MADAVAPSPLAVAPRRKVDRLRAGELLPDATTPLEKQRQQLQSAQLQEARDKATQSALQLVQCADVRALVQAMRPEEFQAGAGGALPGTTLRAGGRFDLGASLEHGLANDQSQAPDRAEKRQLTARRVEGGGNKGLATMTAAATTMGIFMLGPLGAACGGSSLLVDAVKGPELIFVNGKITPAQVKAAAARFERARPLPRAITLAIARRALQRVDLDDDTRASLESLLRRGVDLPDEVRAEGERAATVALLGRRLERDVGDVDDEDVDAAVVALVGMSKDNRRLLGAWLRDLARGAGARVSPRAVERLDAVVD